MGEKILVKVGSVKSGRGLAKAGGWEEIDAADKKAQRGEAFI